MNTHDEEEMGSCVRSGGPHLSLVCQNRKRGVCNARAHQRSGSGGKVHTSITVMRWPQGGGVGEKGEGTPTTADSQGARGSLASHNKNGPCKVAK